MIVRRLIGRQTADVMATEGTARRDPAAIGAATPAENAVPATDSRRAPCSRSKGDPLRYSDSTRPTRAVYFVALCALLVLAFGFGVDYANAAPKWRSSRASTYGLGAEIHSKSCTTLASGAGPLDTRRPVIAHRSLKFGTLVEIRYRDHGRWYRHVGIVLDRGPYANHADFDLGPHMARATHLGRVGVGRIQYRVVGRVKSSKAWKRYGK